MRKYNIPIFVPHKGCPFDCVFCNQNRITGHIKSVTPDEVTDIIERYLATIEAASTNRNEYIIEVAFFGGSFTGIQIEEQSALMERVEPYIKSGRIDGIRLSTRPDYISREILDNLKRYNVTAIELGVQSLVPEVLEASNRGHTPEQVKAAVSLIRKYDFSLGLQMMTGLPGDTPERSEYTAEQIIAMKPDCVRIYPTLTIKDTALETLYKRGEYVPETLDEAVELSKNLLLMFEAAGIAVIRIGLQPTDEINEDASVVAGPFHASFGELVESAVYYDIARTQIMGMTGDIEIYVNPREISKMTGNRRSNIIKLQKEFNITVKIKGDSNLEKREVNCIPARNAIAMLPKATNGVGGEMRCF
ncbi:MAG: radical SAM protein [Oscillospiraceae bacterium]|nr:radical SAM protein [Oscillospiraceae bacterium]